MTPDVQDSEKSARIWYQAVINAILGFFDKRSLLQHDGLPRGNLSPWFLIIYDKLQMFSQNYLRFLALHSARGKLSTS